jgi:hypothetical protein
MRETDDPSLGVVGDAADVVLNVGFRAVINLREDDEIARHSFR